MRSIVIVAAVVALWIGGMRQASAEEYVSKEDFQKLVSEIEKIKARSEKLESENDDLKTQVKTLRAGGTTTGTIDDKLAHVVFEDNVLIQKEIDSEKSGTTKFLCTGSTFANYVDHHGDPSSFETEVDPIFFWKLSDKLSFESEVVFGLDNNGSTIELEYANMAYFVDDYLTVQVGKFKSPFGLFNPRFDPPWINKFPDAPMAYDDGAAGLVPHQELGIMGSGAIEAGPTKFKYATYVSNGLRVEQSDPAAFGLLINNDNDSNRNKGVGGHLAFLPIPELDLGISGEYSGNVLDKGAIGKAASGKLIGVDVSYIDEIKELKGTIDFKAEWVWSKVGNATYTINGNPVPFNNNRRNGGYAQMAYRPTRFDQRWVKNLEFAARYDHLTNPGLGTDAPVDALFQRQSHDRYTFGLNYWLEPSMVLKFDYENDSHDGRTIWLQYALGF